MLSIATAFSTKVQGPGVTRDFGTCRVLGFQDVSGFENEEHVFVAAIGTPCALRMSPTVWDSGSLEFAEAAIPKLRNDSFIEHMLQI